MPEKSILRERINDPEKHEGRMIQSARNAHKGREPQKPRNMSLECQPEGNPLTAKPDSLILEGGSNAAACNRGAHDSAGTPGGGLYPLPTGHPVKEG